MLAGFALRKFDLSRLVIHDQRRRSPKGVEIVAPEVTVLRVILILQPIDVLSKRGIPRAAGPCLRHRPFIGFKQLAKQYGEAPAIQQGMMKSPNEGKRRWRPSIERETQKRGSL